MTALAVKESAALDGGLRLMIYDTSDRKAVSKALKKAAPDPFDSLIDSLDIDLGLSHSWWAGGLLFRKLRRFDHVAGFDNWADALAWVASVGGAKALREVQFWGHGSPGKVWMKNSPMTKRAFEDPNFFGPLMQIKDRLTTESLLWFRTCATFCAVRGQEFAVEWANQMNCRVAAHTYNIGLFQSGLHSLGPGETPRWPATEGISEGTPDNPQVLRWSMPWCTNTVFALQSHLPLYW